MYQDAASSNILMLLNTGVYPLLAAVIASFLFGKLRSQLTALGALVGFSTAMYLIHTGLSFPPSKALDFLLLCAPAGIVISLIQQTNINGKAIWLAVGALATVTIFLLVNPVFKHQGFAYSIFASLLIAVIPTLFLAPKTESQGDIRLMGVAIASGLSAPVIAIGGSLLLGQLIGALGVVAFGSLIVSRWLLAQKSNGIANVSLMIFIGLMTQAHVLADIPLWFCLAAVLALVVAWLVELFAEPKTIIDFIKASLPQAIISAALCGIGLWAVWPESSLY